MILKDQTTSIPSFSTVVSIIVPCRNEERYVAKCLDSIIDNDYPNDLLEVFVIDGGSEDMTRVIVEGYRERCSYIRILDNPKKTVPAALNLGIRASSGEIIMRMDAHAIYPHNYISRLVFWLQESGADNVGGVLETKPCTESSISSAIALGLSHPFGVGNSYFRIGTSKNKWVDTVPFGCYRREVFDQIGMFDEELIRNQDDELNLRLLKNGGRILLVPEVISTYFPRDSLTNLWRMYLQYGYYKPLVLRKVGRLMTLRQIVPSLFVISMVITLILLIVKREFYYPLLFVLAPYALLNLTVSFFICRGKKMTDAVALCAVFPLIHISYGLGYIIGYFDYFILKIIRFSKFRR